MKMHSHPLIHWGCVHVSQWMPETGDSSEPLKKTVFSLYKQPFHLKEALYGFSLADPNCQPHTLALWGPGQVNKGDLDTSAAILAQSSRRRIGDQWWGEHRA